MSAGELVDTLRIKVTGEIRILPRSFHGQRFDGSQYTVRCPLI